MAMLAIVSTAVAKPPNVNSSRPERTAARGITDHEKALQAIADRKGGTRYTPTTATPRQSRTGKKTLEEAGCRVTDPPPSSRWAYYGT